MVLAGDSPRSRAHAHHRWAKRYNERDNPKKAALHLDRAMHYMRLAETRFGRGNGRGHGFGHGFGFWIGDDHRGDVPTGLMVGTTKGESASWNPATRTQEELVDTLL